MLAESLDDIENAFQQAVSGRPADLPFADICIPSVFDDSLAPAGKHVMSLFTQWVPHEYADAPYAAELAAYADRVLARLEAVAPGFTDSVLHRQVIGPHQMQEEYGLVGGNIFHGELSLGQMFHARPAAGYADLRTPVGGLYQAGSATHGGGGVTGIPGRNVVRQVLADRRARALAPPGAGRQPGGTGGESQLTVSRGGAGDTAATREMPRPSVLALRARSATSWKERSRSAGSKTMVVSISSLAEVAVSRSVRPRRTVSGAPMIWVACLSSTNARSISVYG